MRSESTWPADRRIAFLEMSLARNLAWIAAADAKTAVIFAIGTAMIGLLAAAAPAYGKWTALGVILVSASGTLLVASLLCLTAAIFPRMKGPQLSLIFFGGISNRSTDKYREDVMSLDEAGYLEDLIQQVHINAGIAAKKYLWVRNASVLLYVSTTPWFAALFVLFRDR